MIIVELLGGIGSQMFQYAAAWTLARKNNVQLKIDSSYLTSLHIKSGRNPEILKLNISKKTCAKSELRKFLFKTQIRYLDIFIRKKGLFKNNVYDSNNGILIEDLFGVREGYLRGYFFDLKYFNLDKMREIFKKEFELKDKSAIAKMLREIGDSNSVSIHVRRGDLLRLKEAYVLPNGYYDEAIRFVCKNVKNPVFYFFSDDIKWCRENFKDLKNCVFIGGNDAAEDFELMKNCKHHILANSSLSWWVGYLQEDNGLIVCPGHFGTFKNNSQKELINKKWVILDS
ncbi:MAG: alpha-1,2-fucosyltransferase [Promethearchaeota archaeon]